ncbi:hypothetical protein Tco_0000572 [Tanacetum coccineum]
MEESLAKFMAELAKRHEENSNIIKEIRASTDATIRNQGASIKTLELQIRQMTDFSEIHRMEHGPYVVSGSQHRFMFPETGPFPRRLHNYCCDGLNEAHGANILDAYDDILPQKEKRSRANVSVMPFSTYTNLGLGDLSHIDIPEDNDVPLILGQPFLSTAHVKIDVYKRKVTLRGLHTAYPKGWKVGFDTAYLRDWIRHIEFLGVGTTFDIFQNIHILYLQYGVLTSFGYSVLSFIPLCSLPASAEVSTDTFYISHEMDSESLQQTYVPKVARQACFSAEVRLRSEHNYMERKKFERRCQRQTDLLKEKYAEIASLKAYLSLKKAEAAKVIRLCGQVATVEAAETAWANELIGLKEWYSVLEEEKNVLEKKVVVFDSTHAAKETELTSLTAQTAKLTQYLSELEGTCSGLHDEVSGYMLFKEQIEVVQDEQVKVLSDRVAGLDVELMGMALHLDEEFYPYFLTTIAGRRWILSRSLRLVVMKCLQSLEYLAALRGAISRAIDKDIQDGLVFSIDHGKARKGLADVASYNPSAEANYISIVNALCAVDFPFLAQLASQKDASIANIMGLLHLEGPVAETPKANQLQPSFEQIMLPIHRLEDQVVIGETFLSFSLDVVHARVQRIRRDVASQRLSISDAMVALIEPLSAKNIVGEASTSGVPVVVAATTALSTTFVQASSIPPMLVSAYDAELHVEVPSSSAIIFEMEELENTPERPETS